MITQVIDMRQSSQIKPYSSWIEIDIILAYMCVEYLATSSFNSLF